MNIAPPIVDQLIAADAGRRHVGARIAAAAEAHAGQRDRQRAIVDRLVREGTARSNAVDRFIANRPALDIADLLHGVS